MSKNTHTQLLQAFNGIETHDNFTIYYAEVRYSRIVYIIYLLLRMFVGLCRSGLFYKFMFSVCFLSSPIFSWIAAQYRLRENFDIVLTILNRTILQMGLEPMTLGLLDPRSNQLSYKSLLIPTGTSSNRC